jgi:hypothetical protein
MNLCKKVGVMGGRAGAPSLWVKVDPESPELGADRTIKDHDVGRKFGHREPHQKPPPKNPGRGRGAGWSDEV